VKRRLFRIATAALLATGVAVPATAQAANANPITVISAINSVYSLYNNFLGGGLTLSQAVDQIKATIAQAQTAIVDEIDLVAAADVKSCAQAAVINYANIDLLTTDNLQQFAFDLTNCVTLANSLLPSLTDKAAVDEVGFALQTVAPLALTANAKAGFSTAALRTTIINASNTDISQLFPNCRTITIVERDDLGRPVSTEVQYSCTAYNGDSAMASQFFYRGQPVTPPVDEVAVQDEATRNTSRAVAQTALTSI
jgi:hypothetical protein